MSKVANAKKLKDRKQVLDANLFSRLPAVYASSRKQGQKLLQAGGGLSIVEWRILWELHEIGPMSIRDLAYVQRADHSLISRALPEIRAKGLIATQQDEADGRQTIVKLTDKGRQAYQLAAPVMKRRRAKLRENFSEEEIQSFISMLDRIEAFLNLPIDEILKHEVQE